MLTRLNDAKRPNSFWARTDPSDVARVESRTFICSRERGGLRGHQQLDGPRRDQVDDDRALYRGSMTRSRYVCRPLRHGAAVGEAAHVRGRDHRLGVACVCSMPVMARIGAEVLERIGESDDASSGCLHSVGAPLEPVPARRAAGRATTTSTSSTSPRSGRSGPMARATAATPCSARSATRCASPPPWRATRAGWPSTC